MTPEEFVKTYLPFAKTVEKKTGFSYLIPLTQGAQESGWGKKAVGNNFFGIKDTDGINDNEQLIITTEFSKNGNLKFPIILSKVFSGKLFKYTIKDYFRKYDSAEIAFTDHINFFLKNPRYKEAIKYKQDPDRFFIEIAKAGYATDPNYATNLIAVKKSVLRRIK
jgi:flagellar protein FlgJ